jgi:hypothetical protein
MVPEEMNMSFRFRLDDQRESKSEADRRQAEEFCRIQLANWEDRLTSVNMLIIQVPHRGSNTEYFVHVRAKLSNGAVVDAGVSRFSRLAATSICIHLLTERVERTLDFENSRLYRAMHSGQRILARLASALRPRSETMAVNS